MLVAHPLFNDTAIFVGDVHCTSGRSAFGPTEAAPVFSLVLPRSGVFVAQVRGAEVVVDPNHALILGSNEPYRVRHPLECGDRCSVFCISADLLDEVLPQPCTPGRATIGTSPWVDREHRSLVADLGKGTADALRVEEDVLTITGRVMGGGQDGAVTAQGATTRLRQRRLVENAKEVLAARFTDRLGLNDLARELNSSVYHLSRLFRAYSGIPIHRYQNRLRIRAAMERLAMGEDNLSRLAVDLGYADHSHFTHSFRRELGMPPSEARRLAGGTLQ